MAKLIKVPMSTYSVCFLAPVSVLSLNLKMDLAAMRKPMAAKLSVIIKVRTRILSNIPMYLPAASRLFIL
tara:strand:+ start:688 stop:897 length:210 start_codon:yes stop_codon:yes gene_type:complete